MKNSTTKNSSKVLEGVQGVVFFNKDYTPRYVSVEAWEKAGTPENCFVYDGVNQLLSCGINIVDAIEVEGRWVRCPLPAVVPTMSYRKHPLLHRAIVRTSKIPLKSSEFITEIGKAGRKLR